MHWLVAGLMVMAAGCKERPIETPVVGSPAADDAGPRADDAGSVPADTAPAAELAGSWHGVLEHKLYGRVQGDVLVEAGGNVSYAVAGEGMTHSGVFRVTSWDGETLVVKDSGDTQAEYRLQARLVGNTLTLTVEPVGEIVLRRRGATTP